MKSVAASRVSPVTLLLALLACGVPRGVSAQEIQLLRGQCGIYFFKQAIGLPPVEVQRTSPEFFSVYADSDGSQIRGNNPNGDLYVVGGGMMQRTEVFADSIYIHEDAGITSYGAVQSAIYKSDGSVLFRVPAGRQLRYHFGGTLWVVNPGDYGAHALASVTLSSIGPDGATVLATESIQTDPELPHGPEDIERPFGFSGILTPGDYLYEAHLSVDVPQYGGEPFGVIWLRFAVHNVPTAVEPVAWGKVKSLFR